MNTQSDEAIELFKIVINFLDKNMFIFFMMFLTYLLRNALSDLIKRLTNLTFRNAKSEVGITASSALNSERSVLEESDARSDNLVTEEQSLAIALEESEDKKDWYAALEAGDVETARTLFNEYESKEKDNIFFPNQKAFFLYALYVYGKDNSAIAQLEQLIDLTRDEDRKERLIFWLSFCFKHSSQYDKEILLWKSTIENASSEKLITAATIGLAHAFEKDGDANSAKSVLLKRLATVKEESLKAQIYSGLASVEKSLNNSTISVYCKDKSLEYDADNRDELFNSAYAAGEENIEELSIANYITLLKIDINNSTALNNLAVRAKEAGLEIKAVEIYKKAVNLRNTLSMSNLGYLFLNAGFTDEAEEIAKTASLMEHPHNNIYTLLSTISQKKEQQNNKWNELIEKYYKKQKQIRLYVEQYYLGSSNKLDGDWILSYNKEISISIDSSSGIISCTWCEPINSYNSDSFKVELSGKISGSTFDGTYKKSRDYTKTTALGFLGLIEGDKNISCIGYLSHDDLSLNILSEKQKDDFSLILCKKIT